MKGLLQGRLWRALLVWVLILGWAVAGAGCGGSKVKEATEKSNLHLQLGINYFGDQMIPQAIIELENEPAYLRRGVDLDNVPDSKEASHSTWSINDDDELEVRGGNSFLHDNVD